MLTMLSSNKLIVSIGYLLASGLVAGWICGDVLAMPAKNGLFSHSSSKPVESEVERSFQQFINSSPDSTLIGELKPNSSELDNMLMREKIVSTIMNLQEMEKSENGAPQGSLGTECFIEVNVVERVAGRCRVVNNGLPICQSNNYMAINSGCI